MSPEMWKKEYFPFSEYTLDLPTVKINLHKQMLFIVNDYVDNYVLPLSDYRRYLSDMRHMSVSKSAVKQAKLRQMIFNRLLEDFSSRSKYGLSETLKVCVNELRLKYSLTKMMQIVEASCVACNVYAVRGGLTKMMQIVEASCVACNVYAVRGGDASVLIPLVETQVVERQSGSSAKDWMEIKAQLPLVVDSNSTYVPGKQ